MHLQWVQTLLEAQDGAAKVTSLAWAPNNLKLAVVTVDRVISIFDDKGTKKDRFSTKPSQSGGPKNYLVRQLAWSPDSTKLAVAQSDDIVFVYKLSSSAETSAKWGEKKSICNKFHCDSSVTAMTWPSVAGAHIYIGTADGKVRVCNIRKAKMSEVYATQSFVVALATSPDGLAICSGHADGKIYRYSTDGGGATHSLLAKHSCAPYGLAWGQNVAAAGGDRRIVFYDAKGRVAQRFDYSADDAEREYGVGLSSPSGQTVVFGGFNRLRAFNYNARKNAWDDAKPKQITNMYSATALAWRPDGSRVALGTLCGAVDVFDCCLRKTRYRGAFDFTYTGPSQVIVTKLSDGARCILKSHYNYEIKKVNILGNDRYIVANTTDTLLVGDLASAKLSEIPWRGSGNEKFFFENPTVCLIFNAGELSIIEYGVDDVLGSVRTEYMNPHLLSVRVNDRVRRDGADSRKVAYLVDPKTIAILDLEQGLTIATIDHDNRIDWLELNETGRKLLYRDKRHRLLLFDLETSAKSTILSYCSYVQWVPGSDVVVAQNRDTLCIWYNIESPERVTTFSIKGDVEDIERVDGRTEVVVDEGINQVSYALDEGLIEFGTAMDDGDFHRAISFLESLEMTPESGAMWRALAQASLDCGELAVAERCYAALGDVSKARYLRHVNEIAHTAEETMPGQGFEHPHVKAELAALRKEFKVAETIYLEGGETDRAMEMYQSLHKWDDALLLAEIKQHPDLEKFKQDYQHWLAETGQEEKAGELKENEGDMMGALDQYMKAGLPARAAQLVASRDELSRSPDIVERVAAALLKAGLYDRAGELFERVRMNQRALEAYKQGHAYRKAVELCRHAFPNEVVPLEEEWADYLVKMKQMDSAINHYIEAGCSVKAIEAAIASRQWSKAAQIVELQDESIAQKYNGLIASHFEEVRDFRSAERYYLAAHDPKSAIDMHIRVGEWEAAHALSMRYMQEEDVADLYVNQAEELERQGRFKDAEKLYVTVREPDLAITMYKKLRQFDDMIRLVKRFHPDLLDQTHVHLAKELEADSQLPLAEHHYIAGDDWKSAVNMYRAVDNWDDAHRLAKQYGGPSAAQQVGYLWAKSLGGDSAIKLLTKFGIVEVAIDFACEQSAFDFAFEVSRAALKSKLPDIYLRHAMHLEDQGRFKDAEDEFIKAARPKEAVLMYVHAQDWDGAQRVAEQHDPESVSDVLVGQARGAFQSKNYAKAETFLLRAQRPEIAVKYYKEAGMWKDVFRLAKEYMPHKMEELHEEYEAEQARGGGFDIVDHARSLEDSGEYSRAVDTYLRLNTEHTSNIDLLEEHWEKAVELATKFVPDRAVTVTSMVCSRLIKLGRHEPAADLYLGVEMTREAIEACIEAGAWDKARALAKEHQPDYAASVEEQYVQHLKTRGGADDAEKLVNVDVIAGLDMMAERHEWQSCLTAAEKEGGQVLNKYAAMYAAHLVKEGRPDTALAVFHRYGAPANAQNFNVYRRVALELLNSLDEFDYAVWAKLRDMLLSVLTGLKSARSDPQVVEEFGRLLMIVHLTCCTLAYSEEPELHGLAAKVATALLRYTETVAADKAFYLAGMACKKAGNLNMAFVLLNRYLDLVEAIEEGSLDDLDNTDFAGTDVPFEIPLPPEQYLAEPEREEVKEWVLTISVDSKVEQELDKDHRGAYAASLLEPNSKKRAEPCIISGYPAIRSPVAFEDGRSANKEDFNKFLVELKASRNDKLQDVMRFLGQWCGVPQKSTFAFS